MTALDLTAQWPVPTVAAAVIRAGEIVSTVGEIDHAFRLASLAKPISTWAMLVAVEEGIITLDSPAGQPGCTLRHLLAHAGGYPFGGRDPIAPPERTRTYSNSGIELAAEAVEAASGMPFAEYLRQGVFEPLGMTSSELRGSPAYGMWSTVRDFAKFVVEVRSPSLISATTASDATRVQYPLLSGIVPGVGRYDKCPWGLGFEIRGDKSPHWTGALNSAQTSGHFGGAGTMFWIDPVADMAVVALTDRMFDEWGSTAMRRWPELSDAVLTEFASPGAASPGTASPGVVR